jgi:hypothetical protein
VQATEQDAIPAPKPSFWNPPNVISIIALSITTLSLVFPFVQVQFFGSKISKSPIEGDGFFFIPLILIAFLLLIAKKKVGYSIASILIILLSIFEVVWFNNRIEEMGEYKDFCQRGIGFTFLVLGAIMLLVSILMHAEKKK